MTDVWIADEWASPKVWKLRGETANECSVTVTDGKLEIRSRENGNRGWDFLFEERVEETTG